MDDLIRSRMHEALDAIPSPHYLRALDSIPVKRALPRSPKSLRFEPAFGLIAALLALAIIAGLLYARGQRQTVPISPAPHAIPSRPFSGMVTPEVGWFIGPGGHVFRTSDGGARWDDVTPPGYSSNLVGPYFLDAKHAWITEQSGPTSIVVLRTTDGGSGWQRGDPIIVPVLHGIGQTELFFLDDLHGWLLGSSTNPLLTFPQMVEFEYVYRTTDGGVRWQQIADSRGRALACPWTDFAFSSLTTGWMSTFCGLNGGKPDLLVSHDGGTTWARQSLPVVFSDGTYLYPPLLVDAAHGWLAASGSDSQGLLLTTSDGGLTWTERALPGVIVPAGGFLDAQIAWVVAGPPTLNANDSSLNGLPLPLYRTDDGGRTWQAVKTNLALITPNGRITDLYFVSRQYGFAVAQKTATYTNGSRTLYGTGDGGATWSLIGPIPT